MSSRILFCVIGVLAVLASGDVSAQGSIDNLITWNPVSDPGVSEILVYRSTTQDIADLSLVATVSSSASSYTDTAENGAVAGVRYYYRLRSRTVSGAVSGFSAQVSAMYITPSCAPELQAECRIDSVVAVGETDWMVYWSTAEPSSSRLEYWKMGTTALQSTEYEASVSTGHSEMISGLDIESIYFVRAIARCSASENMTVSCDMSFVTSTEEEPLELVVEPSPLDIDEGQTGTFAVRLSSVPSAAVTVSASPLTGDGDISVSSGGVMVFTATDWFIEREVVLFADEDPDETAGESVIRIEGISGPQVLPFDLTVTEVDNDAGDSNNGNLASAVIAIYPMPYQPATGSLTIGNLPPSGRAGIFDLRGRKVWSESWDGPDSISWTGVNDSGTGVASGRYFLVISSSDGQVTEKRVILVVN